MIALIMAGGSGTRLWPLSREHSPKHLIPLLGEKPLLLQTVERLHPLVKQDDVYCVTPASQVSALSAVWPSEAVITEPFGMNTAPCLALSVAHLLQQYPGETVLAVLPADHHIRDVAAFHSALCLAESAADTGELVTFGIIPDHPATGYGYIQAGEVLMPGVRRVERFKEKPDKATAEAFLQHGSYYWNSGIFVWRLDAIAHALQSHATKVWEIAMAMVSERDPILQNELYSQMPRVPVDTAVMEKASNRVVIPVNIGWSDLGNWKALAECAPQDAQGNHFNHAGLAIDAKGSFVHAEKFVGLIGVRDLCVVDTPDALLIVSKDRVEDVKTLVDNIKKDNKDKLL